MNTINGDRETTIHKCDAIKNTPLHCIQTITREQRCVGAKHFLFYSSYLEKITTGPIQSMNKKQHFRLKLSKTHNRSLGKQKKKTILIGNNSFEIQIK